jgi:hypothetical protein
MTTASPARSEARVRARRRRRATGWPTSPCAHKRPTRAHPKTGPPTRGSWVPSSMTTLQASGEPNSTRRHTKAKRPSPKAARRRVTSPPPRPRRHTLRSRRSRSGRCGPPPVSAETDCRPGAIGSAHPRPSHPSARPQRSPTWRNRRSRVVEAGDRRCRTDLGRRAGAPAICPPRRRPQGRSHDGPRPRADGRLEEPWPFIVSRPFVEGSSARGLAAGAGHLHPSAAMNRRSRERPGRGARHRVKVVLAVMTSRAGELRR